MEKENTDKKIPKKSKKPEQVNTLKNGILSIVACVFHKISIGSIFVSLGFTTYMISYLYYLQSDEDKKDKPLTQQHTYFLMPILSVTMGLGIPFSGVLEFKLGAKMSIILGSILLIISSAIQYVSKSFYLNLLGIFIFALGLAVSIVISGKNACMYFPTKRGMISGLLSLVSSVVGSVLNIFGEKVIINPESIDPEKGYYTKDVSKNILNFYLFQMGCVGVCTLACVLFIVPYQIKGDKAFMKKGKKKPKKDGLIEDIENKFDNKEPLIPKENENEEKSEHKKEKENENKINIENKDEKTEENKDDKTEENKDEKNEENKDEKNEENKDEKIEVKKDEKTEENKDEKTEEIKDDKTEENKDEKTEENKDEIIEVKKDEKIEENKEEIKKENNNEDIEENKNNVNKIEETPNKINNIENENTENEKKENGENKKEEKNEIVPAGLGGLESSMVNASVNYSMAQIKHAAKSFRVWRLFLMGIFSSPLNNFMIITWRPISIFKQMPTDKIQNVNSYTSIVQMIVTPLFGILSDKIPFRIMKVILGIINCIVGFLFYFSFDNVYYFIGLILLNNFAYHGMFILNEPHYMKVFGMKHYVEISGIVGLSGVIMGPICSLFAFFIESSFKDNSDTVYKYMFIIAASLNIVDVVLSYFETEDPLFES